MTKAEREVVGRLCHEVWRVQAVLCEEDVELTEAALVAVRALLVASEESDHRAEPGAVDSRSRMKRIATMIGEGACPRGKWLAGIEVATLDVRVWPAGDGEPITVAVGRTPLDAELIRASLEAVATRLQP